MPKCPQRDCDHHTVVDSLMDDHICLEHPYLCGDDE